LSIEADNVTHESTVEELLFAILVEMRLSNTHLAEASDMENEFIRDDEQGEID